MDTEMTVICNRKHHKIILKDNGRLSFPNHPDGLRSERVAVALGGKPCKCLQILLIWQDRGNGFVTNQKYLKTLGILKGPYLYTMFKTRRRLPQESSSDKYSLAVQYRKSEYVVKAFKSLLAKHALINRSIINNIDVLYSYSSNTTFVESQCRKGLAVILFLSWHWFYHIYRNGLAVIDGYIVLDIYQNRQTGNLTAKILKPTINSIETAIIPFPYPHKTLSVTFKGGKYAVLLKKP